MRISDWSSDVCSSDLLHVLVDAARALDVAAGEPADERDVHAADEADDAGLGSHGRQHTHHIRPFLLAKQDGLHVGRLHHRIDDGKAGDRKSTRLNSSHYCASRMPYPARKKQIERPPNTIY